jgi:hypothetical protein
VVEQVDRCCAALYVMLRSSSAGMKTLTHRYATRFVQRSVRAALVAVSVAITELLVAVVAVAAINTCSNSGRLTVTL